MKIQLITFNKKEQITSLNTVVKSFFSDSISFSEFDLNIISLQDKDIWKVKEKSVGLVSCKNDLLTLNQQIKNTDRPTIVFLPQNYTYYYDRLSSGKYYYNEPLKDVIDEVCYSTINNCILDGVNLHHFELFFENSKTIISNTEVNATFSISSNGKGLTFSKASNNKTTIQLSKNCFLSSLNLSELNIDDYLNEIGLVKESIDIPEWVKDYSFFDDNVLQKALDQKEKQLALVEESIKEIKQKIDSNLRYKSILVDTGDGLVKTCFEMLQEILECDLSKYVDEKKADFIIKKESITFVGEIKGISSNVKRGNISQVQRHCADYQDKLDEDEKTENVKGLLIITYQREKALNDREPIHVNVIEDAKKNDILIVTTDEFLKLFEQFLKGEKTSTEKTEEFKSQTGLYKTVEPNNDNNEDNSVYKIN